MKTIKKGKKTNKQDKYDIEITFNGFTFNVKTNDLFNGILSLKPDELFTESYITIKKGEAEFQKRLTLVQTRKLFNDETSLEMFINNLQLE